MQFSLCNEIAGTTSTLMSIVEKSCKGMHAFDIYVKRISRVVSVTSGKLNRFEFIN